MGRSSGASSDSRGTRGERHDGDGGSEIIIGELGSVLGSVLGTIFVTLLPIFIRLMMFGALIIFFLVVEPEGLNRLWRNIRNSFRIWPFAY